MRILISTVLAIALVTCTLHPQERKGESGGTPLFRIEIGKDKTVKVFDTKGNMVVNKDTTDNTKDKSSPGHNTPVKNRVKESPETMRSQLLDGSKKGPDRKLFKNQNNGSPETGISVTMETTKKGPDRKPCDESIFHKHDVRENGTSRSIESVLPGPARKLQIDSDRLSREALAPPSHLIDGSRKGPDRILFDNKRFETPETGVSVPVPDVKTGPDSKPYDESKYQKDDMTQSISLPNLTYYFGTGASNTYTYYPLTHELDITSSVQNNGTASAGSFRVGWYLSTNTTISTGDYLVASATQSSLGYGYYINKSGSVDLDAVSGLPSGTYYVGVIFDDQSAVTETNESDNTDYFLSTIDYNPLLLPNLTTYFGSGSVNTMTYYTSTQELVITNSVQNDGASASGVFRAGWYLSLNTTISTGDYLVAYATQGALSAGMYTNLSGYVDLDAVSGLPAGTYYLGIIWDDQSTVTEFNETDNTDYFGSLINFTPSVLPNLTLYTGSGASNTYTYNTATHQLNITNSVVNDGLASAGTFRVGWYLSTNTTISTSDYLVASASQTSLTNGFYINKSGSVNLDAVSGLPAGTYYVGVYVDDLDAVSESVESDNTNYFYTPIDYSPFPNLTYYFGGGAVNQYLYNSSSHQLDITSSVQNDGLGTAGSFRIGWYLSDDIIITPSDHLVASAIVSGLTSGYYVNKTGSVDLDDVSGLPSGTYYLGIYFDDEYSVTETNETDNTDYYGLTIDFYLPNLACYLGTGAINTYTFNTTSHQLDVTCSVQNNGPGSAGAFRLGWYLSDNTTISTGDYFVASAAVSGLASGSYVNETGSVDLDDISSLPEGTYYLGPYFDDQFAVTETEEGDNTAYFGTPLDFYFPNLNLYEGSGSINSYTYDTLSHEITITNSVCNSGTIPSGSFRIGWYLSLDNTIKTTDYLIAHEIQSGLTNGTYSNKTGSTDLDLIGSLPYGTYYVGVIFDDLGEVTESNESDNAAYFTLPIDFHEVVGIRNTDLKPSDFFLYQNYPNPFNPSTTIQFSVPKNVFVTLEICDINGEVIETVIQKNLEAGTYSVEWNSKTVSSGVYFYRLKAGDFVVTKKLVVVK